MGYTTEFDGVFNLDEPLTEAQAKYLNKFSDTRRMKRDAAIAEKFSDDERLAVDLPIGKEAEFFVGSEGAYGQSHDKSILEYNDPPSTQPGLWCQWVPTSNLKGIEWNGGEKFYHYTEWLQYIITNFLVRWGRTLNGQVFWQGEEHTDVGRIDVRDNIISVVSEGE